MRLLYRYIGWTVGWGYLVVTAVLLPLFSFIAFLQELEQVGKGSYDALGAMTFVLATIPARMLDLAPFIALLGSILALGVLAKNNELTAMRAAGTTLRQIGGAVLRTALLAMLAAALLAQFVAPPLDQWANRKRSLAVSGTADLVAAGGFWSRDGRRFLHVGRLLHGRIPAGVEIYGFGPDGRLQSYIYAEQAEVKGTRRWELQRVREKSFAEPEPGTRLLSSLIWEPFLTRGQMKVLEIPARALSVSDLYLYARYIKETGQRNDSIALAFWLKAMLPLSIGAVVLLALAIVLGSPLGSSFGRRLLLGAVAGIVYYIFAQIVANLGLLVGLSPLLIALTPIAAATGGALYALREVR